MVLQEGAVIGPPYECRGVMLSLEDGGREVEDLVVRRGLGGVHEPGRGPARRREAGWSFPAEELE